MWGMLVLKPSRSPNISLPFCEICCPKQQDHNYDLVISRNSIVFSISVEYPAGQYNVMYSACIMYCYLLDTEGTVL